MPLYVEILKYEECLDTFLKTAKGKMATGILNFNIKSIKEKYPIFSKNSIILDVQETEGFLCYGILVKFVE